MAIEIPLTQGKVALIDEEDFDLVTGYRWHTRKHGGKYYAQATVRLDNGMQTTIKMHRLIFGLSDPKTHTDHINGDGLDNRRENLRAASCAQNQYNRGAQVNNKSGYKGVYWDRRRGKWVATIKVNRKTNYLGCHATPKAAHMAYCKAAIEMHGEFCNFGALESGQKKGP